MKVRILIASLMAAAMIMGCGNETGFSPQSPESEQWVDHPSDESLGKVLFMTRRELAEAKRATAKYQDLQAALDDGYVDINLFVPGQGFHFLKPDLLDGTFEHTRPEILVYFPLDDGYLELVAVEYLTTGASAPEGFTGDEDEWEFLGDPPFWALHAWIWVPNPDGVFAESNPRLLP